MAADCAVELRHHNIAFISLWPGAIKTEVFVNAVRDSSMKVRVDSYLSLVMLYIHSLLYLFAFVITLNYA